MKEQPLEAGSCTIGCNELTDCKYTSQLSYNLLKGRGAPIIGIAVLLLDPRYKWFAEANMKDMSVEYRWEPID